MPPKFERGQDPSILSAYWSQPIDHLLASLQSTPGGLSAADAHQRLLQVGPNTLDTRRQITAFRLFLNQVRTPLVVLSEQARSAFVAFNIDCCNRDTADSLPSLQRFVWIHSASSRNHSAAMQHHRTVCAHDGSDKKALLQMDG
jgi:hypothetical protein